MKQLSIILSVLFFCVLGGCRTSDEALLELAQSNSLGRSWSLHKVSGGLGVSITYPYGQVIWTFNEVTGELTIENNIQTNGTEDVYSGFETGTYTYEVVPTNGESVLFVENQQRGIISVSGNVLRIDEGVAVDGMLTEFEPINP